MLDISFFRLCSMPQALSFSEKTIFLNLITMNIIFMLKYHCFFIRNQEFSLLSKALISVLLRTSKSCLLNLGATVGGRDDLKIIKYIIFSKHILKIGR